MKHRGRLAALVAGAALVAFVACTEVATDPNAVVAIRFDGSAYPSIVVGDSLRDSLGALQPVRATGLNYKSQAVEGATFVFSSPDTNLLMSNTGHVVAISRKTDATPARIFATVGALQSTPDSLFIVPRADSIKSAVDVDTINAGTTGRATSGEELIQFTVFGDTLARAPKLAVPAWLVSFQLLYHGALLPPTDTSTAYTYVIVGSGTSQSLRPTFVDSTDASGRAGRGVAVRAIRAGASEDTISVIATIRARKAGIAAKSDTTLLVLRRQ